MKLPEYTPSTPDRVSTREELFQVLELLGGFDEPWDARLDRRSQLLPRLEADPAVSAEELDESSASDEQFVWEIEPFNSLLTRKAERTN